MGERGGCDLTDQFPLLGSQYSHSDHLPFDFCLSTSIPVLTTSTYVAAWPQGDQLRGGGAHGTRQISPQPNDFRFRFIPRN